jgi:hypothetical protein
MTEQPVTETPDTLPADTPSISGRWWLILLVRGLFTIGVGTGVFISVVTGNPGLSVATLLLLFGLLTLVDGGLLLLIAIDISERSIDSWWLTTSGLFGTGAGLILLWLVYSGTGSLSSLTILLTAWALSAGITSGIAGYVLRHQIGQALVVSGAVTIAFGLVTGGFGLERVAVDTLAISGASFLLTAGFVYLALSLQIHTVESSDAEKITGLASHLAVAIETFRVDLSTYEDQLGESQAAPRVGKAIRAIEEAEQMLDKAKQRLERGDLIACLEYFYAAVDRQPMIFNAIDHEEGNLRTGQLRMNTAKQIRIGRGYLGSGWAEQQQTTFFEESSQPSRLRKDITPEMVRDLYSTVHAAVIGELETVLMLKRLLAISIVALVAALSLFGVVLLAGVSVFNTTDSSPILSNTAFFAPVFLLGTLGAAVNTFRTWSDRVLKLGYIEGAPQLQIANRLVIARVFVGGTAAVFVYIILMSGILSVQLLTPGLVLAAAFAAGFSDQLFVSAIDQLVDRLLEPRESESDPSADDDTGATEAREK